MQLAYSLKWVATLDPAMDLAEREGLEHYGVAVIRGRGAAKLERVCNAWAQLFENGPDVLELSDGVSEVRGHDGQTVEYVVSVLEVRRDDFVNDLRQLASFAARAATEDHYILHFGL